MIIIVVFWPLSFYGVGCIFSVYNFWWHLSFNHLKPFHYKIGVSSFGLGYTCLFSAIAQQFLRQVPPELSIISCRASTSQMPLLQKRRRFQSSVLDFISWKDMLGWPFCAIKQICQDFLWHRSAICFFMLCTKWRNKRSVQSSLKILLYIQQRAMKTSLAAFATSPGVWALVRGFFAHCSDI